MNFSACVLSSRLPWWNNPVDQVWWAWETGVWSWLGRSSGTTTLLKYSLLENPVESTSGHRFKATPQLLKAKPEFRHLWSLLEPFVTVIAPWSSLTSFLTPNGKDVHASEPYRALTNQQHPQQPSRDSFFFFVMWLKMQALNSRSCQLFLQRVGRRPGLSRRHYPWCLSSLLALVLNQLTPVWNPSLCLKILFQQIPDRRFWRIYSCVGWQVDFSEVTEHACTQAPVKRGFLKYIWTHLTLINLVEIWVFRVRQD